MKSDSSLKKIFGTLISMAAISMIIYVTVLLRTPVTHSGVVILEQEKAVR